MTRELMVQIQKTVSWLVQRLQLQNDVISASYASDLSKLIIEGKPSYWIHGHTHERRIDYVDNEQV